MTHTTRLISSGLKHKGIRLSIILLVLLFSYINFNLLIKVYFDYYLYAISQPLFLTILRQLLILLYNLVIEILTSLCVVI